MGKEGGHRGLVAESGSSPCWGCLKGWMAVLPKELMVL